MTERNGNGRKWWFLGPALAVAGIVFGAGGMAYSIQDAVGRQDKCIEALTQRTIEIEVMNGRLDERLKSIDSQLADIKKMLHERTK